MERMKIAAIFADQESLGGKEVTVCGWARTIRDMKTFGFIELNDGSCFKNLQVVMSAEELANYKDIAAQNVGAALIVKGTVVLTPDAKQPLEVKAHSIEVEGKSTPDYPLQKKRHSVEFLRTIQHLRPRTNLFSATFRVRSAAARNAANRPRTGCFSSLVEIGPCVKPLLCFCKDGSGRAGVFSFFGCVSSNCFGWYPICSKM